MPFNMIPFSMGMVGMKQFQSSLQGNALKVSNNMDKELGKLAFQVETKAKEYVPVKTGRLRASIMTEHVRKFYWLIGTNVSYAPPQEFGSSRNKPHPFLRPALQSIKGSLHRLLARADLLKG